MARKRWAESGISSVSPTPDDAVRLGTGKSWAEWFELLDGAGASTLPDAQIAALAGKRGAPVAWRRAIAARFVDARIAAERVAQHDGCHVAASRTITVPVSVLYDAWTDPRRRRRWLGDARMTIRKATPPRSLRITWSDESDVEVIFSPKGEEKTQVTVDHHRLSPHDVPRMKEYWSEHLARLKEILEY